LADDEDFEMNEIENPKIPTNHNQHNW